MSPSWGSGIRLLFPSNGFSIARCRHPSCIVYAFHSAMWRPLILPMVSQSWHSERGLDGIAICCLPFRRYGSTFQCQINMKLNFYHLSGYYSHACQIVSTVPNRKSHIILSGYTRNCVCSIFTYHVRVSVVVIDKMCKPNGSLLAYTQSWQCIQHWYSHIFS